MKSVNINVCFFVLMLFLGTACQNNGSGNVSSDMIHFSATASEEKEEYEGPQIQFDSTSFDFGVMAVGQTVQHTFQFLNAGKSALIISDVRPSCGCTSLKDWPKDPIAPGESGEIVIEFKASAESGNVKKKIDIATNAEPKDYILYIQGKVVGVGVENKTQEGKMHMERTR